MSNKNKSPHNGAGKPESQDAFRGVADAAASLEEALRRFEQLASAARRMSLDTRKNLERAARATTEAAEEHARVNTALAALVQTIQVARERHEANARALEARGEEIRLRAQDIGPLYDRFGALGDEGRAISSLVAEIAARQREAKTPEDVRALAFAVETVEQRMGKLEDDTRDLGAEAKAASATDLGAQCDALRQQIASARNKLGLLRKGMEQQ